MNKVIKNIIYLILCSLILFVTMLLGRFHHEKIMVLIILILFIINSRISFYIQTRKNSKRKNEIERYEEFGWNYNQKETMQKINRQLYEKYDKIEQIKEENFSIIKFKRKGFQYSANKRIYPTYYTFVNIYVLITDELDENAYDKIYNRIENDEFRNLFPIALIILSKNKNIYSEKLMSNLSTYHVNKSGLFTYSKYRDCVVVTNIYFQEKKMVIPILPYNWYYLSTNTIKNIFFN